MRANAGDVRERQEHVVVHGDPGSPAVELRIHARHRPEQVQRLVHEMGAQIVQEPRRAAGRVALAPAPHRHRTPALESGLEAQHVAQRALGDEAPYGQGVAVPAPLVIRAEEQAASPRLGHDAPGLLGGRREGLVDHDRQPGREGGQRQRDMRGVRSRDHHEVVPGRVREDGIDSIDDARGRVLAARALPSLRARGDDRREVQARGGRDRGGVEARAGQAVADQRDADLGGHGLARRPLSESRKGPGPCARGSGTS